MCFIPNSLQQSQRRRPARQAERIRPAGEKHLLFLLRQADHGLLTEVQLLEYGKGGAELAPASIDDEKVRQRPALVQPPPEVPRERLLQRPKVVVSPVATDPEASIFALVRSGVRKEGRGRDHFRPLS